MISDIRTSVEASWRRAAWFTPLLVPLSWLYAFVMALRNAAYDAGILPRRPLGLPTISIGNLTVGGSGKTPVSAWIAQRLLARGERPAILLRGYGDDEPLVHARLTPEAIVVADADRSAAAARARALGATVLVLDDAFQHRRAGRDVDVVLVSAEQGLGHRVLPAGPLREAVGGLRRASLIIVTRKSVDVSVAAAVAEAGRVIAPGSGVALAHLRPDALVPVSHGRSASGPPEPVLRPVPLETLRGERILAVSAIGAPRAFEAQLAGLGAAVTSASYPDHHGFDARDVTALTARAEGLDRVVCTLKDAVKLGPLWPPVAPPLWYLSQTVDVERGGEAVEALLDRLVGARRD